MTTVELSDLPCPFCNVEPEVKTSWAGLIEHDCVSDTSEVGYQKPRFTKNAWLARNAAIRELVERSAGGQA